MERNAFDYARAFANTQSNDPTVVQELIDAYAAIAKNLGISIQQFLETYQNIEDSRSQALYLCGQLNSVRSKNALMGLSPISKTPNFITRGIRA